MADEKNVKDETTEAEEVAEPETAPEEAPVAETPPEPEVETPAEPEPEVEPEVEVELPAEEPAAAPEPGVGAEAEAVADEAEAPAEEAAPADTPADEAPAAKPAAEPEAAPVAQSGPKPKRKRLPRALRPQKTRPTRQKAATRKPIVRLEKPEHERGRRQERQGTVVSDAMEKTIVVRVDTVKAHPRYKKVVRQSAKFHAHDEQSQAKVGDVVRIVETRPLSKMKRWRLAEVVEAAK